MSNSYFFGIYGAGRLWGRKRGTGVGGGVGLAVILRKLRRFSNRPPPPFQFILPFQNWFPHNSLHIVKATPQPKPNPAEVHHILYL